MKNVRNLVEYLVSDREIKLAWLLLTGTDKNTAINTCGQLYQEYSDDRRWIFLEFQRLLGAIPKLNDQLDELMNFLSVKDKSAFAIIAKYIFRTDINSRNLDNKEIDLITRALCRLYHENFPLLYSLLPFIQKLLGCLGPSRIFSSMGIYGFDLLDVFPKEYIESSSISVRYFRDCFSMARSWANPEVSTFMQRRLCQAYAFPACFPQLGSNDGRVWSLLHSSIMNGAHFVDLVLKEVFKLGEQINASGVFDVCDDFHKLTPWLIVGGSRKGLNNYLFLKEVVHRLKSTDVDFLPFDFMKRLRSDMKLMQMASSRAKSRVTFQDLKKTSIPKLFIDAFSSNEIQKISRYKFYYMNDTDKDRDMDFIRAYNAILAFVLLMRGRKPEERLFETITQCVKRCTNRETREALVIHLYSLIFLKDGTGRFICKVDHALWLLNILILVTENVYVHTGYFIMSCMVRELGNVETLEKYMITPEYIFARALYAKNWRVCELYSERWPAFAKIYNTMRRVTAASEVADRTLSNELFPSILEQLVAVRSIIEQPAVNKCSLVAELKHVHRFTSNYCIFAECGSPYGYLTKLIKSDFEEACNFCDQNRINLLWFVITRSNPVSIRVDAFARHFAKSAPLEVCAYIWQTGYASLVGEVLKCTSRSEIIVKALKREKKPHLMCGMERFKQILVSEDICLADMDDYIYCLDENDMACIVDAVLDQCRMKQLLYILDFLPNSHSIINEISPLCLAYKNSDGGINPTVKQFRVSVGSQKHIIAKMDMCDALRLLEESEVSHWFMEDILLTKVQTPADLNVVLTHIPGIFSRAYSLLRPKFADEFRNVCPMGLKSQFIAYMDLPDAIARDSIFGEPETIVDAAKKHRQEIIEMKPSVLRLIDRDVLLTLIKFDLSGIVNFTHIKKFCKNYNQYRSTFVDLQARLDDIVMALLVHGIQSIKVEKTLDEFSATRFFDRLLMINVSENNKNKLTIIHKFLQLKLYESRSIEYDFHDYPSNEWAKKIASLSFDNDYPELGVQFCSLYGISSSGLSLKLVQNCFHLGNYRGARTWAPHSGIDEYFIAKNIVYLPVYDTSSLLAIQNVSVDLLRRGSIAPFNHYRRLKVCARGNMFEQLDNAEFCYYATNFLTPMSRVINILTSHDCYDLAFTLLSSVMDQSILNEMFVNDFLVPSLMLGKFDKVVKFVCDQDPTMSFTRSLWDMWIAYLKKMNMKINLFYTYKHLGWMEEAALAAISIFSDVSVDITATKRIDFLTEALLLLDGTIESRKANQKLGEPDRNIKKLMHKVAIQKTVYENHLAAKSSSSSYDFLSDESNALNICVDMIFAGKFNIIRSLLEVLDMDHNAIWRFVAKQIHVWDGSRLTQCIIGVQKSLQNEFDRFFVNLLTNMLESSESCKKIPSLISRFSRSKEQAVMLYMEFKLLREAMDVAEDHLPMFVPVIAYHASVMGDIDVIKKCDKYFRRKRW